MIKKILLGLVVVLLALAGFIASRPSTFIVKRTLTMKASPRDAFPYLHSFYRWVDWSPWEELDPAMKRTYEGPVVGVGSIYAWAGNAKVGSGRMTMEELRKNEFLRIKLEFLEPFPATNTITFTLEPVPEGVAVTWAMEGHHGFMGKAFSLFMDMDAMVGKDFEKGLARLRPLAEAEAQEEEEEEAGDEMVRKAMAEAERATSPSGQPAPPAAPAPRQ